MTRREQREAIIFKLYRYDLVQTKEEDDEFPLFNEIVTHIESIDAIIEDALERYKLSRLSYLDRAIIRLATYEMVYTDTPKAIIIDEAIELTKAYSDIDDKQRKFNNRLLQNIKESLD